MLFFSRNFILRDVIVRACKHNGEKKYNTNNMKRRIKSLFNLIMIKRLRSLSCLMILGLYGVVHR